MTNTPTTFFGWIIFLIQQYHGYYLQGLLTTLETSLAGTICGCFLGFLVGIIQATDIRAQDNVIKKILLGIPWVIAKIYVTIFRGTPMIVQAMVIYYGSSTVFGIDLKPFNAAIFIILLNTGAYMSETVRGGINSIDVGQIEGAKALGMGYVPMMIYIILPQTRQQRGMNRTADRKYFCCKYQRYFRIKCNRCHRAFLYHKSCSRNIFQNV